MQDSFATFPAPAKLNLMLHITGRREDGYHNLQTLFQFVDFCDRIKIATTADPGIHLETPIAGVAAQDNLIVRAAGLLQRTASGNQGARIGIEKRIPMGAGLGGGSSNAATTLVALNHLWRCGLSAAELASLGLQLGADVPYFVAGHAAWGEGIGERLTPVTLPEPWFLVITPDCQVSTREIFCHRQLTRNTSPITIAAALEHGGKNDCETIVKSLYPAVNEALNWLGQFASAQLTGTGSSLFASFESRAAAEDVYRQLPVKMAGFVARGLNSSPLQAVLQTDSY